MTSCYHSSIFNDLCPNTATLLSTGDQDFNCEFLMGEYNQAQNRQTSKFQQYILQVLGKTSSGLH